MIIESEKPLRSIVVGLLTPMDAPAVLAVTCRIAKKASHGRCIGQADWGILLITTSVAVRP